MASEVRARETLGRGPPCSPSRCSTASQRRRASRSLGMRRPCLRRQKLWNGNALPGVHKANNGPRTRPPLRCKHNRKAPPPRGTTQHEQGKQHKRAHLGQPAPPHRSRRLRPQRTQRSLWRPQQAQPRPARAPNTPTRQRHKTRRTRPRPPRATRSRFFHRRHPLYRLPRARDRTQH